MTRKEQAQEWLESFKNSLLLNAHYLIPRGILLERTSAFSRKDWITSLLSTLGVACLVSLALVIMVDGMESVHAILSGNWMAVSQFSNGTVLDTFMIVLLILSSLGILLPFIVLSIVNLIREKEKRSPLGKVLLTSLHGIMALVFFTPLVSTFAMILHGQNPQMFQILDKSWWDGQLYAFLLLIILGVIAQGALAVKLLGFSRKLAFASQLVTFLVIAAFVLVIVL